MFAFDLARLYGERDFVFGRNVFDADYLRRRGQLQSGGDTHDHFFGRAEYEDAPDVVAFDFSRDFVAVFFIVEECDADGAQKRLFAFCRMPCKNFIGLNEQSVVDDGAKPETRGDELCLIAFAGAAPADERVYGIGFERLNQFAYDITKYPHCFALHPYLTV